MRDGEKGLGFLLGGGEGFFVREQKKLNPALPPGIPPDSTEHHAKDTKNSISKAPDTHSQKNSRPKNLLGLPIPPRSQSAL